MTYLSNAFSLQMVDIGSPILTKELHSYEVRKILSSDNFISCVGHESTANVLSNILELTVPYCRQSIKLGYNDTLIVAQVIGGRLPEGATSLPDGVNIKFILVKSIDYNEIAKASCGSPACVIDCFRLK